MSGWNLTGTGTAPAAEQALTVSQASQMAADALAALPVITVLGEVSGFRGPNARSGHCYFQMKDDAAAVDCIIWRGVYGKRAFDLRDGLQVLFTGTFSLYKPTGRMSFHVKSFTLAGEGLLRQQVAELAEKLRREGLMDPARKRPIPAFCSRVAVVTSLSGAVIDDVKRTLARRNPLVEIVCVGASVQGDAAVPELVEALDRAARLKPDCILLVRGGGSFEDLMTFNDERLARAVAACPVPVVTGIGHEPDNSICDMVGDRRCSTPTAAAESVAPSMAELVEVCESRATRLARATSAIVERGDTALSQQGRSLARSMGERLARMRLSLDAAAARPCMVDPTSIVDRRRVELAQTGERIARAAERVLARFSDAYAPLPARLVATATTFDRRGEELAQQGRSLAQAARRTLDAREHGIRELAASLEALSPLKVLARGYSITYGERGVVEHAADVRTGDNVRVRLADGSFNAQVTSVEAEG